MFGRDYKDRIVRYLETYFDFSERGKAMIRDDDFKFIDVVCNALKRLITELNFSVDRIRKEAIEIESVIIPVQFWLPNNEIVWDLEKPYFLAAGGTN